MSAIACRTSSIADSRREATASGGWPKGRVSIRPARRPCARQATCLVHSARKLRRLVDHHHVVEGDGALVVLMMEAESSLPGRSVEKTRNARTVRPLRRIEPRQVVERALGDLARHHRRPDRPHRSVDATPARPHRRVRPLDPRLPALPARSRRSPGRGRGTPNPEIPCPTCSASRSGRSLPCARS